MSSLFLDWTGLDCSLRFLKYLKSFKHIKINKRAEGKPTPKTHLTISKVCGLLAVLTCPGELGWGERETGLVLVLVVVRSVLLV